MDKVLKKLDKLNVLDALAKDISEIKQSVAGLEKKFQDTQAKVEGLYKEIEDVRGVNRGLLHRVEQLERDKKRNNIIIFGLAENETSTESLRPLLQTFFEESLKVPVVGTDITDAHRIGARRRSGPRPVIVTFCSNETKWRVLPAARNLKGSRVNVSQDYTQEERAKRKILLQYRRSLKDEEGLESTIKGFQLVVNGKLLSIEHLSSRFPEVATKWKRNPDSPSAVGLNLDKKARDVTKK